MREDAAFAAADAAAFAFASVAVAAVAAASRRERLAADPASSPAPFATAAAREAEAEAEADARALGRAPRPPAASARSLENVVVVVAEPFAHPRLQLRHRPALHLDVPRRSLARLLRHRAVLRREPVHGQRQVPPRREVQHPHQQLNLVRGRGGPIGDLQPRRRRAHLGARPRVLPRPLELQRLDVAEEPVHDDEHLARSELPRLLRARAQRAVVLPDPSRRVHREPDVGPALHRGVQRREEVAPEERRASWGRAGLGRRGRRHGRRDARASRRVTTGWVLGLERSFASNCRFKLTLRPAASLHSVVSKKRRTRILYAESCLYQKPGFTPLSMQFGSARKNLGQVVQNVCCLPRF